MLYYFECISNINQNVSHETIYLLFMDYYKHIKTRSIQINTVYLSLENYLFEYYNATDWYKISEIICFYIYLRILYLHLLVNNGTF